MNDMQTMSEGIIDDLWEDYKLHQYKEKYDVYSSDSDSEFDDEEGNYCCNDDCCESSKYFVETDGYILCGECGTIQKSVINDEKEWNNYTDTTGKKEDKGDTEKHIYNLLFKTYNAQIEGKFEKSELRQIIQILDNAIV